jgi:hypothetical protein
MAVFYFGVYAWSILLFAVNGEASEAGALGG